MVYTVSSGPARETVYLKKEKKKEKKEKEKTPPEKITKQTQSREHKKEEAVFANPHASANQGPFLGT